MAIANCEHSQPVHLIFVLMIYLDTLCSDTSSCQLHSTALDAMDLAIYLHPDI